MFLLSFNFYLFLFLHFYFAGHDCSTFPLLIIYPVVIFILISQWRNVKRGISPLMFVSVWLELSLWRREIGFPDWLANTRSKGGIDDWAWYEISIRENSNASTKYLCKIINLKTLRTFLQGICPISSSKLKTFTLELSFGSILLLL